MYFSHIHKICFALQLIYCIFFNVINKRNINFVCLNLFNLDSMAKKKRIKTNNPNTPKPTQSRMVQSQKSQSNSKIVKEEMLFGKKNLYISLGGIGLMILGFILMSGGHMPSGDVWDPNIIYSPRRIVLAPILLLAGLGMQVYAIFAKK